MVDITDVDYGHAKRACKNVEINKYRTVPRFACLRRYIIVRLCI